MNCFIYYIKMINYVYKYVYVLKICFSNLNIFV